MRLIDLIFYSRESPSDGVNDSKFLENITLVVEVHRIAK